MFVIFPDKCSGCKKGCDGYNIWIGNHMTEKQIEAVLNSPGNLLVMFSAAWCGPCQQMIPILQHFEHEYGSRMRVLVVKVEDAPNAVNRFSVSTFPTIVALRNGEELGRLPGRQTRSTILGLIEVFE